MVKSYQDISKIISRYIKNHIKVNLKKCLYFNGFTKLSFKFTLIYIDLGALPQYPVLGEAKGTFNFFRFFLCVDINYYFRYQLFLNVPITKAYKQQNHQGIKKNCIP